MRRPRIKMGVLALAISAMLASCGGNPTLNLPPIENIDTVPLKTLDPTDEELRTWSASDLTNDTIPGMSVQRTYDELLEDSEGKQVIVAVIDSGVDIDHEDLDDNIWVNEDEIPGNGKDDDKNGYIDDIHGWNFLGDIVKENLEYQRILRDKDMFSAEKVAKAQKEYDEKLEEANMIKGRYGQILENLRPAHKMLETELGKDYTQEDVENLETEDESLQRSKMVALSMYQNGISPERALGILEDGIADAKKMISGEALQTNYREENLGDDPYSMTTTFYGNNDVDGPTEEKEDATHGTHVAGIIAAERNNGIGMNGVADNAKIMVLRAVPDGDEYDKDIALAIRYAVDNGAKVINTSFGKYHSTHPEWVWDAIKYAADNDVLIVNAAGNEGIDIDDTMVYPQDQELTGPEISNNFLTVGALNYEYGADLVANFSNYGKQTVDIFGPGVQIYATTPNNEYRFLQGTSMASPNVAGVAAMVRSYYPKLTAAQVKQIIMDSGVTTKANVMVGGSGDTSMKFAELSVSGKMANLYNAMIMASNM